MANIQATCIDTGYLDNLRWQLDDQESNLIRIDHSGIGATKVYEVVVSRASRRIVNTVWMQELQSLTGSAALHGRAYLEPRSKGVALALCESFTDTYEVTFTQGEDAEGVAGRVEIKGGGAGGRVPGGVAAGDGKPGPRCQGLRQS